ncbi:hypothetical protein [Chitinasiproducens palmae]|uniref:Uncharacterized protein n=1 Tax=Chitinasiproducens palmae TaxID=1770053 RepID=A0A1H2PS97_9BURK|nr:hypothetical protein [Chitinasiproducens palmae]SDV49821.1 hypothetical protein SAMN05216551_109167 [Chitinasiproducens palmae]
MLTRDQILGAQDRASEVVPVPEWQGDVTVTVMSGAERDAFLVSLQSDKSVSFFEAALVAATVVDEHGNKLFGPDDVPALQAKNAAIVARVAAAAFRLNGLGPEAVEKAEKNSESGPNSASPSA